VKYNVSPQCHRYGAGGINRAERVDGVQRLVLNLIQDACSSKLLHSVAKSRDKDLSKVS